MQQPPKPSAAKAGWEDELQRYQVVYLAKRPVYEFILAVSNEPSPPAGAKRALFRLHFCHQRQPQGVVLEWNELEDFYESFRQLMEYVEVEQRRHPDRY